MSHHATDSHDSTDANTALAQLRLAVQATEIELNAHPALILNLCKIDLTDQIDLGGDIWHRVHLRFGKTQEDEQSNCFYLELLDLDGESMEQIPLLSDRLTFAQRLVVSRFIPRLVVRVCNSELTIVSGAMSATASIEQATSELATARTSLWEQDIDF